MRIVVLVGLPGSGKSTYLERIGAAALSSDAIRKLLADDETDQSIHARVFRTVRFLLRQRLAIGRAVTYIDATNLTPKERQPYIAIGKSRGCDVEAVFFDVPLAVCLERNAKRHRVVPVDAMMEMAAKLVAPSWKRALLGSSFKPQAGAPYVNLIARSELLAAPVSRGHIDRAAIAKNARAELAFVVADAVIARFQADMRVFPRYGCVSFIAAFFKDNIVAAHHAMFGVGQLRQASDVGAGFVQGVFAKRRLAANHD